MEDRIIIKLDGAEYTYRHHSPDFPGVTAVCGIDLELSGGCFAAVIGRNGSGKSTFARLLNALLLPTSGTVYIKGINTRDGKHIWDIRSTAGMVFQNPDNQIIGTTVEEDTAFGPENLGIPACEIRRRVDEALESVGMLEYCQNAPHQLSGGQKQRVAIAGVLAMKPECIVLDEATSMLDPSGRSEMMAILRRLNREEGITVIHITHNMDEAIFADRVIVMDEGGIVMDGSPGAVFSDVERIKDLGLDVPQITELFFELNRSGLDLPRDVLDVDEAFRVLAGVLTVMKQKREKQRGGAGACP